MLRWVHCTLLLCRVFQRPPWLCLGDPVCIQVRRSGEVAKALVFFNNTSFHNNYSFPWNGVGCFQQVRWGRDPFDPLKYSSRTSKVQITDWLPLWEGRRTKLHVHQNSKGSQNLNHLQEALFSTFGLSLADSIFPPEGKCDNWSLRKPVTFDIKGECRNELAHGDEWGTPAPCCGFWSGIAHVFPQSKTSIFVISSVLTFASISTLPVTHLWGGYATADQPKNAHAGTHTWWRR